MLIQWNTTQEEKIENEKQRKKSTTDTNHNINKSHRHWTEWKIQKPKCAYCMSLKTTFQAFLSRLLCHIWRCRRPSLWSFTLDFYHHVVLRSRRPLPLFPGVLVLYTSFLSPDPLGSAGRSSQQKRSLGVHTIHSQMTFRHCFPAGQGCAVTCLLDSWLWTFSEHFQFSGFKHHPWFCSQT